LNLIEGLKNGKNRVRPVGHRSVEWRKPFVCNKMATPGWVAGWRTQAEGHGTEKLHHRGHEGTQRSKPEKP